MERKSISFPLRLPPWIYKILRTEKRARLMSVNTLIIEALIVKYRKPGKP